MKRDDEIAFVRQRIGKIVSRLDLCQVGIAKPSDYDISYNSN